MSASDEFEGFESVSKQNPMWEPKSKGSKKTDNFERRTASDKSWIMGYYIGRKDNQGPRNNSTVHTVRVLKGKSGAWAVGDMDMVNGTLSEGNCDVDFWGTGVLDGEIAENVAVGTAIKVTWKGKVQSKKDPEKFYNAWDLAVNKGMVINPFEGQSSNDEELTSEFEEDNNPFSDKVQEEAPKAPMNSIDEDDDF